MSDDFDVVTDDVIRRKPGRPPSVKPEELAKVYPAKVKMTRPYGFLGASGIVHYWHQGQVVTDATDIKTMVDRRCADFVVV